MNTPVSIPLVIVRCSQKSHQRHQSVYKNQQQHFQQYHQHHQEQHQHDEQHHQKTRHQRAREQNRTINDNVSSSNAIVVNGFHCSNRNGLLIFFFKLYCALEEAQISKQAAHKQAHRQASYWRKAGANDQSGAAVERGKQRTKLTKNLRFEQMHTKRRIKR